MTVCEKNGMNDSTAASSLCGSFGSRFSVSTNGMMIRKIIGAITELSSSWRETVDPTAA